MDVEAPSAHHQRAGHGGDELAGDGDLALAQGDGAVDRVAALGGPIAPAHDLAADVGRRHQRRQVDIRPGGAPAKGRGQVPGEAQRRIVGPAGGAGARIEDAVGALLPRHRWVDLIAKLMLTDHPMWPIVSSVKAGLAGFSSPF